MQSNENNQHEYDPKVVSLGPYHHGKHEVQFLENLKPMVARVFVSDDGNSMDIFYNKVLLMVDETGSFYIEGSTDTYSSDEEFAEMMYLDGCFILGMIESISGQKPSWISKYDEVITRLGVLVWYSISADTVFMLEKQTPFQVLESLMSIKFEDDEGIRMIAEYLDSPVYSDLQFQNKKEEKGSKSEKQPLHLLELFRAKYIIGGGEVNQPLHNRKPQTGAQKHKFRGTQNLNFKDTIQPYQSVTTLKAKGIHFPPSYSKSLNAFTFKSSCFYGRLKLHPFFVSPKTKMMLSNMIAYELCQTILITLKLPVTLVYGDHLLIKRKM